MDFLDILTILSFVVGLENLRLNDLQMTQIDDHLSKQDNDLLKEIIRQNEEIIRLLNKEKI
jgi:hypothetical protein